MPKTKIHIFRSDEHLPTHPIDKFNRVVAPKSKVYVPESFEYDPGSAYLFGEYTKENLESQRFGEDDIGRFYFRKIGLKGGNMPRDEWGEAATSCWGCAELLPADENELESKIGELLKKIDTEDIIHIDEPIIAWVYSELIPVVQKASKDSDLWVVRHYRT